METKLNSLNIIDDLVINPQFNKSKIKKLLDELSQEAYAGPLSKCLFAAARFVREKSYDIMSFYAVLLNLPITAKMIAIIAVFAVLIIKLLAIAYL